MPRPWNEVIHCGKGLQKLVFERIPSPFQCPIIFTKSELLLLPLLLQQLRCLERLSCTLHPRHCLWDRLMPGVSSLSGFVTATCQEQNAGLRLRNPDIGNNLSWELLSGYFYKYISISLGLYAGKILTEKCQETQRPWLYSKQWRFRVGNNFIQYGKKPLSVFFSGVWQLPRYQSLTLVFIKMKNVLP